ncbi:feather keratin-like [Phaenicophaeus curvirostris]|uniref:feather keratin-like n=1 Tax=Phaenicophaeus curvirostris TaxID=33595 RepID=UPI0037F0C1B7
MACNDLCRPCAPAPLANSCNEPCVRQCQDSSVVIQPSTVLVTLPGPILTSFPQSTTVGSSASAAVGSELSYQGVPVSNGAFGYGYGYGLGFGYGYGYGLGGLGCYGGRALGLPAWGAFFPMYPRTTPHECHMTTSRTTSQLCDALVASSAHPDIHHYHQDLDFQTFALKAATRAK